MKKRPFGKTGLSVTPLCIGTSALGSPPEYDYEVSGSLASAGAAKAHRSWQLLPGQVVPEHEEDITQRRSRILQAAGRCIWCVEVERAATFAAF
jgi:aryl-alcohol dehydrogenase-like predicted oxidoreductase